MKRRWLLLPMVLALMLGTFVVDSHAAIVHCDFSSPKNHTVDGWDLSQFIANYAGGNLDADVNKDGSVDSKDVAHFALFFGKSRLPNILLIIGDDIGMDVTTDMYPGLIEQLLGLYDPSYHDDIHGTPASTPVLDSLASQGMRFKNAWAQPFCSPTRASIMTGLFTAKHNVTTYATYLSDNHTTFVQKLRYEAGYSTAAFGKWHLAGFPVDASNGMMPKQAGFELYKGILGAAPNSYWNPSGYVMQNDNTGDESTVAVSWEERELDGIGPTTYLPVVKTADTIDWINEKQTQTPDKPWFAYLAMNLSHGTGGFVSPLMVVPDQDTLNCNENTDLCDEIETCSGDKFGSVSESGVGTCTGQQLMRAMTTSMDTVIGRLLDAVNSIPSDTYVIYIGDNGTPMYSSTPGALGYQIGNMYITRGGRGKGTAYESGARVAMVIKGPGIEAGQNGEIVHAADLFSTILELAGLTPPVSVPDYTDASTPVDSVSLAPILFDSADTVRDPNDDFILTDAENIMPGSPIGGEWAGARNATYKVISHDNTNLSSCEFYNLETDPLEEYQLTKPGSCESYTDGTWTPETNPDEWNFCHLFDKIKTESILAD